MANVAQDGSPGKTVFVTLFGGGLMLIFIGGTIYQIEGTVKDLIVFLDNVSSNVSSTALTLVIAVPLMTVVLTPILLTIGFLRRRNWGRLGIMVISLLAVATNAVSMTLAGVFYPQQILWILFYLSLFMMLRLDRIKKEFLADANQEG